MTDESPTDEGNEKRLTPRYQSTSRAVVVRESDKMRTGFSVTLHNISVGGVGFCSAVELDVGEDLKLRIVNEVQRIEREVRGKVRRVSAVDGGDFFCGVELYTRLTPLDVSLLRTNIAAHPDHDGPLWI